MRSTISKCLNCHFTMLTIFFYHYYVIYIIIIFVVNNTVQFVQFGFIEESLQIPFLAVAGLGWTFIISAFAGNAKKSLATNDDELTVDMNTNDSEMNLRDIKEVEEIIVRTVMKEEEKVEEKEMVLR